jgi:peptide chain release factor 1
VPRFSPFETWGNTAISRSPLTDHRIGLTLHQLAEIMEGKLQSVIDAVVAHFPAERLKAETANIA